MHLRRMSQFFLYATLASLPLPAAGEEPARPPAESRDVRLFAGKDLEGWRIVDQVDFERHGEVRVQDDHILLQAGQPATGVAWKGEFPRSGYEVRLEAKRVSGNDFFCGLTFPVGDEYCTLILGGWGGGTIGLSNIDGMSAIENETTNFREFEAGQWYPVRLRVTEDRIEAWLGEDQIVDVAREGREFGIWWEQEPVRPFGIVSWNTTAAIRKIRLVRRM